MGGVLGKKTKPMEVRVAARQPEEAQTRIHTYIAGMPNESVEQREQLYSDIMEYLNGTGPENPARREAAIQAYNAIVSNSPRGLG